MTANPTHPDFDFVSNVDPSHVLVPHSDYKDGERSEEFIEQLADSAEANGGFEQPILVTEEIVDGQVRYRCIDGWSRTLAALRRHLLLTVKVLRDKLSITDELTKQFITNALHKDASLYAKGVQFHHLMQINGWKPAEVARHLNIGENVVSQALKIFHNFPEELRDQIPKLGRRLCYLFSRMVDVSIDKAIILDMAGRYLAGKTKVERLEKEAKPLLGGKPRERKPKVQKVTIGGIVIMIPVNIPPETANGALKKGSKGLIVMVEKEHDYGKLQHLIDNLPEKPEKKD